MKWGRWFGDLVIGITASASILTSVLPSSQKLYFWVKNFFFFFWKSRTFLFLLVLSYLQYMAKSMVYFMLSAVADLSGSFPKTCFKQLFCRELPVPASVKRNSTPGAILEIFQNFTNMQDCRPWFGDLKFTIKKLHYRDFPRNFPKLSSPL